MRRDRTKLTFDCDQTPAGLVGSDDGFDDLYDGYLEPEIHQMEVVGYRSSSGTPAQPTQPLYELGGGIFGHSEERGLNFLSFHATHMKEGSMVEGLLGSSSELLANTVIDRLADVYASPHLLLEF